MYIYIYVCVCIYVRGRICRYVSMVDMYMLFCDRESCSEMSQGAEANATAAGMPRQRSCSGGEPETMRWCAPLYQWPCFEYEQWWTIKFGSSLFSEKPLGSSARSWSSHSWASFEHFKLFLAQWDLQIGSDPCSSGNDMCSGAENKRFLWPCETSHPALTVAIDKDGLISTKTQAFTYQHQARH